MEKNAVATGLRLNMAGLAKLDVIFPAEAVTSGRYSEEGMRPVDL